MPSYGVNEAGVADFIISWNTHATTVDQSTIRGQKVASVTKGAAGVYDVVLTEDVYRVVFVDARLEGISPTPDTATASVYIQDETASPLTFKLTTLNAAGAADNLTNGRRVYVLLKGKLSSV